MLSFLMLLAFVFLIGYLLIKYPDYSLIVWIGSIVFGFIIIFSPVLIFIYLIASLYFKNLNVLKWDRKNTILGN